MLSIPETPGRGRVDISSDIEPGLTWTYWRIFNFPVVIRKKISQPAVAPPGPGGQNGKIGVLSQVSVRSQPQSSLKFQVSTQTLGLLGSMGLMGGKWRRKLRSIATVRHQGKAKRVNIKLQKIIVMQIWSFEEYSPKWVVDVGWSVLSLQVC